jgi:hypothetical protein
MEKEKENGTLKKVSGVRENTTAIIPERQTASKIVLFQVQKPQF